MTGVHQAAAGGGAAAPGNPAAAAAPGAGHVTGNAPPLSHSQATGPVPPLSGPSGDCQSCLVLLWKSGSSDGVLCGRAVKHNVNWSLFISH